MKQLNVNCQRFIFVFESEIDLGWEEGNLDPSSASSGKCASPQTSGTFISFALEEITFATSIS